MSDFPSIISLLIVVYLVGVQFPEVDARMSDDMMFPKPQNNKPDAHVLPDEYIRQPEGKFHLGLVNAQDKKFNRLPGVCKRIRRRRIRILCNVEKYCTVELEDNKHGQICPCPRGSKCSRFFLKSL